MFNLFNVNLFEKFYLKMLEVHINVIMIEEHWEHEIV